MAKAPARTIATRTLEVRGVRYEAMEYDPGIRSGEGVAQALGVPPEQVLKTLVMQPEGGRPILVMVRSDREVAPKVLARELGVKSVRMVPKADAERITGLQTGGIGALALLDKPFAVYIDRDALGHETVLVNGGRRGLNLKLAVADLVEVTHAEAVRVV